MDKEDLHPIYESTGISVWASTKVKSEPLNPIESACLGKESYPTPNACLIAIRMLQVRKRALDYYKCQYCDSYHLTSKGGDSS